MFLVSAVITTKNRCDVLVRALNSVNDQIYAELEIVVVDDASTDNTQTVCKNYKSRFPLKYVRIAPEESKGGNYARNQGILNASGDYIAFLDDDDEWLEQKISEQMDYMEAHPEVSGVVCAYEEIYLVNGKNYSSVRDQYCCDVLQKRFELGGKAFPYAYAGITSGLLMKKQALLNIGMFDENLKAFQEVEMTYRFRCHYEIGAITKPLLKYYNSIQNRTVQVSTAIDRVQESYTYIEHKYAHDFENMTDEARKTWEFTKVSNLFDRCARAGNRRLSWKYGMLSLKYLRSNSQGTAIKFLIKLFVIQVGGFGSFVKLKTMKG